MRDLDARAGGRARRRAAAADVTAQLDADQFRTELEAAYTHILSRTDVKTPPADAPVVDIEAAASIPIPEHRTINSAVRLFSVDMKDSIQTSLIRSAKYKKLIDKALAEQKLPKGLAYLPVIESAYLPTLTSRAGAHGIWQFMPDTAREYGLRVDWWVDERADPERSTRAAAAYLKDLHRMFDDWSLALAAYNCGPGRVRRTLNEAGASTFWELLEQRLLPKETRGYVPTFYATLLIASDPGDVRIRPRRAGRSSTTKRVDVRGPVSLAYIAEAIGVDEDLLQGDESRAAARRRSSGTRGRARAVEARGDARRARRLAARGRRVREVLPVHAPRRRHDQEARAQDRREAGDDPGDEQPRRERPRRAPASRSTSPSAPASSARCSSSAAIRSTP